MTFEVPDFGKRFPNSDSREIERKPHDLLRPVGETVFLDGDPRRGFTERRGPIPRAMTGRGASMDAASLLIDDMRRAVAHLENGPAEKPPIQAGPGNHPQD